MNICASQECSALRSQKKASDPLELSLQMVMSYHVGSGSCTQVLWKSSQLSSTYFCFFPERALLFKPRVGLQSILVSNISSFVSDSQMLGL